MQFMPGITKYLIQEKQRKEESMKKSSISHMEMVHLLWEKGYLTGLPE